MHQFMQQAFSRQPLPFSLYNFNATSIMAQMAEPRKSLLKIEVVLHMLTMAITK